MCDPTVKKLIQEGLKEFSDDDVDCIGQFIIDLKTGLMNEHVGTVEFADAINTLDEAIQTS